MNENMVINDSLIFENISYVAYEWRNIMRNYMRKINKIVVHCAATRPNQDIGAKEIDSWHRARGWSEIGYHYVIRRNGVIEPGRCLEKTGAHIKGYNSHSIGVCLVGGVDADNQPDDNFTDLQHRSLRLVLDGLVRRFPDVDIRGHRDFPDVSKACPSFDVRAWLDTID